VSESNATYEGRAVFASGEGKQAGRQAGRQAGSSNIVVYVAYGDVQVCLLYRVRFVR
jgi:ribose/xylose/arabinose/galactoside ABC-type transport system permease subunit